MAELSTSASPLDSPVRTPAMMDDDASDKDDLESLLSEVDEAQFEDFDPTAVAAEAIPIDEANIHVIGVHKRKREEGAGPDSPKKKKKKEGRREKPKRSRKRRNASEPFSGGEEIDGKRARKPRGEGGTGEGERLRRARVEVDEETLTPEERRRRALDRAMDEALRNPNTRRKKKDGIDLDALADQEIEEMRSRMTRAAEADNRARQENKPAVQKVQMLKEVTALLNRNTLQNQLVDPDINLLEAVRFFLEPLSDGSLPAYNIQRELFAALMKLPINKDTLVASGIGKVVLFYTKSKKVETNIKRQAEKLISDWMRPILKRTDDYRKRNVAVADYDPTTLTVARPTAPNKKLVAREKALAMPDLTGRAKVDGTLSAYNIAPRNNLAAGPAPRQPGESGDAAFRRLKMKHSGKSNNRR